jgi:outer membrane protein assembly factor BamB
VNILSDRIDFDRTKPVGVIAGLEVIFRGIGDFSFASLVEFFGDWVLASLAVGLSSGWVGQSVGEVMMWAFYGFLIYFLLPDTLPDSLSSIKENRVLVGYISVSTIIVASFVASYLSLSRLSTVSNDSRFPLQDLFLLLLIIFAILVLYLKYTNENNITSGGSVHAEIMDEFDEVDMDLIAADGSSELGGVGLRVLRQIQLAYKLALPVILIILFIYGFGAFIGLMSTLYPIPELLFIGSSIFVSLNNRVSRIQSSRLQPADLDLEAKFGTSISHLFNRSKGYQISNILVINVIFIFLFFSLGVFALDLTSLISKDYLSIFSDLLFFPERFSVVARFSIVGLVVTFLLCSITLLWAWLRLLDRIKDFLTAWDARGKQVPGRPPLPDLSRPPYGPAVPFLVAIPAIFSLIFLTRDPSYVPTGDLLVLYGLLWPLSVIILIIWVYRTVQIDTPQPALSDGWIYPGSVITMFVITLLAYQFVGTSDTYTNTVILVVIPIELCMLYYYPDLQRYLEKSGNPWQQLKSIPALVFVIPLIIILLSSSFAQNILIVGIGVCLLSIPIGLLFERYREDTLQENEITDSYDRILSSENQTVVVTCLSTGLPAKHRDTIKDTFSRLSNQWDELAVHPNIADVNQVGGEPHPWVAVEKIHGEPFSEIGGTLTRSEIRTCVNDIFSAIRSGHNQGVECVYLVPDQVILQDSCDRSKAIIREWGFEPACASAVNESLESPFYPPEMWRDSNATVENSVVYNIGALLYFLITGQPPSLDDTSTNEGSHEIQPRPSELNTDIDPLVDEVLSRSLNPDPRSRYESLYDFEKAINNVLAKSTSTSVRHSNPASVTSTSPDDWNRLRNDGAQSQQRNVSLTRREVVGLAGVGVYGISGYTYTKLGGANDPLVPDKLEYVFHSRRGTLQWSFSETDITVDYPTVYENNVYIGGFGSDLYALDIADGTISKTYETDGSSTPVITEDIIYIGAQSGIKAIAASEGSTEWFFETENSMSAPLVAGEFIYGYSSDEEVFAVDAENGSKQWSFKVDSSKSENDISTLSLANGLTYTGDSNGVYALDAIRGTEEWFFETGQPIVSTTVSTDTIYVGTYRREDEKSRLYALDCDTGTERWKIETPHLRDRASVVDGTVYIGSADGLHAFDTSDGNEKWLFEAEGTLYSQPVVEDEVAYVGGQNVVYGINIDGGTEEWTFETNSFMRSPAIAGDTLFIGGNEEFYAIGVSKK